MCITMNKTKAHSMADKLKAIRQALGLNQTELAGLIDASMSTISNAESGRRDISEQNVHKLISYVGVSKAYLAPNYTGPIDDPKLMFTSKPADISALKAGTQVNPWKDVAFTHLKEEIAFYRNLLNNLTGGKGANFLQALNASGLLLKGRQLSARA